MTRGTSTQ